MAAERKPAGERGRPEQLTLVALYDEEERTAELLQRLAALGVETGEATTVRVELNQAQRSALHTPPGAPPLPPVARSAVTGAIVGGGAALLVGVGLYEGGALALPFLRGLFAHAFLSVLLGAALGAGLGALILLAPRARAPVGGDLPGVTSDGYLVVVRIAPHLAEQAEEIARLLGAKEILL